MMFRKCGWVNNRSTHGKVILAAILGLTVVALPAQQEVQSQSNPPGIRVRATAEIVGPQGDPFTMPSDAAVGPDGRLYVLDGVHHRVVVYDPNGALCLIFGSQGGELGQFLFPLGIATGGDGKVYVADSGNHRIQVLTPDGKALEAIQLPTAGMSKPPDPTDAAVDLSRGRLYVADNDNHRLCVYDLTGRRFEQDWGDPGLGRRQFRFPFLIDVSTDGYVLVVEPINTRVQVINAAGKFVGFIGDWGVKPGQLFRPKGVTICQDRVFVTDSYLGRVQVFDLKGNFLGALADFAGTPLKLTTPTGITMDARHKRLFVVELKADRVCRMDLE